MDLAQSLTLSPVALFGAHISTPVSFVSLQWHCAFGKQVLGVERPFPRPPSPKELDGSQTNREVRVKSGTPWREQCGLP